VPSKSDRMARETGTASAATPRYVFRCECVVRFLVGFQMVVASLPGRTRNLSRSGLSVVVRRPFRPGEAVEVELRPPDRAATYLAGIVRFAKYAGGGYYEVGVGLEAASNKPIFSRNPMAALDAHPWLRGPALPP